ncbi:hypothetical protein J2S43_002853 [Catenuloplanes nepalensis]|uniref:Uncharacterized protein n=1 Tax=Catenuloplanes nepalensis TaxID=587533 RepID=A0ABT9MSU4_9ACTN|nr:hypothetical protein [Catenuloplanes nepalensis]MDP9794341.1 hypothetical protein [Catenuloplanes nepalensis]
MSDLRFELDPHYNAVNFTTSDERYGPLGVFLISEISTRQGPALDALAVLDDATRGEETEPWDSESYEVTFDEGGLRFQNRFALDQRAEYTLDEIRPVIESYWRFVSAVPERPGAYREYWPDLPRPEAEVLLWEKTWGRAHPYRGRLF